MIEALAKPTAIDTANLILSRSTVALVATVWASTIIFGSYILIFFAGGLVTGDAARWNQSLPELFNPDNPIATIAIGVHFLAGGIILALGPVQLFAKIRQRAPRFHHYSGRIYLTTTFLAGAGGLVFIVFEGTLGGPAMNLGFGLYGSLMIIASYKTYQHARARRIAQHRAWGMRLFSLAIGSWLYRMEYGFWFLTFGELGHSESFDGPFDIAMTFLFYLPNLLVVEALLRSRRLTASAAAKHATSALFVAVTAFIALASYEMTLRSWGPAIQSSL
jgi:hypothetical protein